MKDKTKDVVKELEVTLVQRLEKLLFSDALSATEANELAQKILTILDQSEGE